MQNLILILSGGEGAKINYRFQKCGKIVQLTKSNLLYFNLFTVLMKTNYVLYYYTAKLRYFNNKKKRRGI